MTRNLSCVIEILGGPVIPLLQAHVVLGLVEECLFQTQTVLLWLGPHPLRAFADPDRAGLVDGHHRGNESTGERTHLCGLLQRHAFAGEFSG